MPLKRRIRNSSNHLSTALAISATSLSCPTKLLKQSLADTAEHSRPRSPAFTSSVVLESVRMNDQLTIGGFLERCHYCKKKIGKNSEVFMYSDLCAFCSSVCRDLQIALDQLADKQSEQPIQKLNPTLKSNIVKGQFSS